CSGTQIAWFIFFKAKFALYQFQLMYYLFCTFCTLKSHIRTLNNYQPIVLCLSVDVSGVVMMDKTTTGVWLLHSTPRFPFLRDQNKFWPDSGAKNAQTFICVTFKYDEFQQIGNVITFTFDDHIPADFHENLQKLRGDDNNNRPQRDNEVSTQDLTSEGGTSFCSFAKKRCKEGDLYLTIAETYKTDVRVQTWGGQSGRDGDYCEDKQRQVINIDSLKTDLGTWNAGNDHSKWCVSTESKNHLICIADMNRSDSQYERPGGALCFEHKKASQLFKGVAGRKTCTKSKS
uniref:Deoxyribonuclease-2-alpha n=1 Tax=Sander lucioperca TaxID=283035 RepID=A0A8D0A0F8_SANLU